jgi:cytochrome c oxidase cbb3-type subunit 3
MSEQDRIREHEYDGIQEFDNRLPNWWLFTLYGAILFAFLYWFSVHTWRWAPLSHELYEREMAAAAERQLAQMADQELTDDAFLLMAQIPATVERGRAVFEQFCVTCHKADGSGQVGPNLTDAYWLHGAQPLQIHHTVTNGVPEKGMAAWANQLGPMRVQDVVAYVLTLKGKNRPGKEPQGTLEASDAATTAAAPVEVAPGADSAPAATPAGPPAVGG